MAKMIGVEIGSDTLKMAVCSGGVVKKVAIARMPEELVMEGRMTSTTAMVEFLKTTMKANHISGGACALVIPSQHIITHRFTMPAVSDEELRLNLPYEFRDFVGKESDQYLYDYIITGMKDNVLSVYASAVRKDVMEEFYATFKKAGLTLKIAVPSEMAWMNLLSQVYNLPPKLCIVDIGYAYSRISIFDNGNFVMGKTIERGGALIDEVISSSLGVDKYEARARKEANADKIQAEKFCQDAYQDLTIEIMKVLNFYAYSDATSDVPLEHLYYTGGSSQIEALRTTLLKNTHLVQHHIYQLVNMGDNVSDLALFCALAAGATCQQK